MGTGDAAVQWLCSGSLDARRCAVSSSYSGVTSPGIYQWWRALDVRWPTAAMRHVCSKVLVNQAVLGPANCAMFLCWSHCATGLWSAGGLDAVEVQTRLPTLAFEAAERIRSDVPDLALKAMGVWMPVHLVTFRFVPPHLRILYTSCVSVLWGGYLSYVAHSRR
uniref:Peroxisomal membrane protein MPV17 n=1 Tax=Zooxanthella nutricula TaxID=1333877 RepID=A0A7S2HL90_9DINO